MENTWDQRYSVADYIYGTQPNDFLTQVAQRIPPGRVLCLAEGEGRNAVYLAQHGYQVKAVDASRVGLEKAQRLASSRGVTIETIAADLADFTIPASTYTGIVSIWAHLPPPIRKSLHTQVVAGLVPGGAFVLEAYTPRQLEFKTGGPPVPELMMTLDALREELHGLRFEIAQEIERDVFEGSYHRGRSAVVQVLAFR